MVKRKWLAMGLAALLLTILLGSESVRATVRRGQEVFQQLSLTELSTLQLIPQSNPPHIKPQILVQTPQNTEADRLFQEGLQLFRQGTAESLQAALQKWEAARNLYRAAGNVRGEAVTLLGIGRVYDALGDQQTALDYYNQSLPLRRQVGDKAGEATTLNNIGGVYNALGDKQRALDYYNQSLPLSRQVGDIAGEATTLNNIGGVYSDLGDQQTALDYYNQSLPLRRQVGDIAGEANTLYNLAWTKRSLGNLTEALSDIEAAIAIIEDLRTKIDSEQLRQSYFAQNQDQYEFYIDLLMQLHQQNPEKEYHQKALHVSERARARTLNELLAQANLDLRSGVDPALLNREQDLQQKLSAAQGRRLELTSQSYSQSDLDQIKAEIDSLGQQLLELTTQIRRSNPAYANLKYPQPLTLAFAALPSLKATPTAPLIADHEIISLPSASSLAVQRQQWQKRPLGAKSLAVLADPVFSVTDDRYPGGPQENPHQDLASEYPSLLGRESCIDFARLTETETEALGILALVPESERFQAFGLEASRATATSPELGDYRMVHFATHGCIEDNPLSSGLALSFFRPLAKVRSLW